MTQGEGPPSERVRVTGPPRRRTPVARSSEIGEQTPLGGMYMGSLVREQLRLALVILAVLALTVGMLPLIFHLFPGLAALHVLGIPLSWLVLGTLVYPALVVLGWAYIRRSERNERDFAELLSAVSPDREDPRPEDGR
ncbi:MAG: hypothetical protein WBP61_03570 [Nocardioides sp.]